MTALKVYIDPQYTHPDRADGGIRRVVEAQVKYLPDFGIEVVKNEEEAELIAVHSKTSKRADVPIVSHNHGLYWDKYNWEDWAHHTNELVIASLSCAVAHTAPSQWVANALRRGMMIYPDVIYHGVDSDYFRPGEPDDYILWNKARADLVSDPRDMNLLARHLPKRKFISTIGEEAPNVRIAGVIPYPEIKTLIENAGLYLATVRETFGIGTIEALACGLPVVGWNWGGTAEIVRDGETGYLAPPGDYETLSQLVERAFAERKRLGANARLDALERWGWEPRIKQYASLYLRTARWWGEMKPKVSLIVTCYNLARFLDETLQSVIDQSFKDYECLIIDDCSTDNTQALATKWTVRDSRFRYIKTPYNMKLSGARNFGVGKSSGRYIQMLDADDILAENALQILVEALDTDPSFHIAYGHLDMVDGDGKNRGRVKGWPFEQFNWYGQMAHYNQLPYCAMMRREVFERCGGYRLRQWRAEDAELWCRATSFGFRARKVTEASTLIYRNRGDSKSKGEPGDGNWTAWFPWGLASRAGEVNYNTAIGGELARPSVTPFGAQGKPRRRMWPVRDYANPEISIVIPVGSGHETYLIDALDSLVAQTFTNWEAIVVNDTGKKWKQSFPSPVCGAPFARVYSTGGLYGPARARNVGAKFARAAVLFWLDADDCLLPTALEKMYNFYRQVQSGIIYTDWLANKGGQDENPEIHASQDFVCGAVLQEMQHSNACLVPRFAHEKIGGYDEKMRGWEDWDYQIALQSIGLCSYRLDEPLFVYSFRTGTVREKSFSLKDEIIPYVRQKWSDYYEGRKSMPCRGCGSQRYQHPQVLSQSRNQTRTQAAPQTNMIMLEYIGPVSGPITWRGPRTGNRYRFAQDVGHRRRLVYESDAVEFLKLMRGGKPQFVQVGEK